MFRVLSGTGSVRSVRSIRGQATQQTAMVRFCEAPYHVGSLWLLLASWLVGYVGCMAGSLGSCSQRRMDWWGWLGHWARIVTDFTAPFPELGSGGHGKTCYENEVLVGGLTTLVKFIWTILELRGVHTENMQWRRPAFRS